jgi:hemerythrin
MARTALRWDPSYRIGNEAIDAQHERLFALAAMLEDAAAADCPDQVVVDLAVEQLYGYIRIHFADEEALMDGLGYPGRTAHLLLHDRFILHFDDLVAGMRGEPDFARRLSDFISTWLVAHIRDEDLRIRAE